MAQDKALLTIDGIKAYQNAAATGTSVKPKYFKFSDTDYDLEEENTREINDISGVWLRQDINAYLPIDNNTVEYICEASQDKADKYCKICGIYLEDNTLIALAKPVYPFPPELLQRFRIQIKYGNINGLTNFEYLPFDELKQNLDRLEIRATMDKHIRETNDEVVIIKNTLNTHSQRIADNNNVLDQQADIQETYRQEIETLKTYATGRLIQRVIHNYTGGDWNPSNEWNWVPGLYYDFTPKEEDSYIKVYWNFATAWENSVHAMSNWKGFANGVELFRNCLSADNWESRNTFSWQFKSWGKASGIIGLQCRSHSFNYQTIQVHKTQYWEGSHSHQNCYSQMVIEEVK